MLGIEVVHADGEEQKGFCHDPLDGAELDISDVGGIAQAKDGNFTEQVVGGSLAIGRNKSGPCGGAPPGNDETEETTISAATGFGSPTVRFEQKDNFDWRERRRTNRLSRQQVRRSKSQPKRRR